MVAYFLGRRVSWHL